MSGLPEALRRRRKELGLTLSQIADQMGVTEATVQRWESGNIKTIRHEKIAKLAEVLDVSPATLMGWDDSTAGGSDKVKDGRKEFYKIMMDIMDEQNLDIPDFARVCNLSDREVRSIIIRHSKTAPLDIALKISAAFNISLEYLNGEAPKADSEKTPILAKKDEHTDNSLITPDDYRRIAKSDNLPVDLADNQDFMRKVNSIGKKIMSLANSDLDALGKYVEFLVTNHHNEPANLVDNDTSASLESQD